MIGAKNPQDSKPLGVLASNKVAKAKKVAYEQAQASQLATVVEAPVISPPATLCQNCQVTKPKMPKSAYMFFAAHHMRILKK